MKSTEIISFLERLDALEKEWALIKSGMDSRIEKLRTELAASKAEVKTARPSQAKEQTGNFPYPVGQVVRVAFPELFKRKLLNAGDIGYLLSEKASADFKTRGYPVLKIYVGENDPDIYSANHRRFYKMPPLELGAKKYHLSSQFYPESREAVLKWVFSRGLRRSQLLEAMELSKKG